MKKIMLILILILAGDLFALPIKEDTAVTVIVGPFVDYADGKTILADNDDFDPNDIVCRLVKGASESTLTLTKSGGTNNINLTGYGMATLTLTAANVDTAGQMQLQFCDAESGGYYTETILPFSKSFTVYPSNVYNSLFADNTEISKFNAANDDVTVGAFNTDTADTLTLGQLSLESQNASAALNITNTTAAGKAININASGTNSAAIYVSAEGSNSWAAYLTGSSYGIYARSRFPLYLYGDAGSEAIHLESTGNYAIYTPDRITSLGGWEGAWLTPGAFDATNLDANVDSVLEDTGATLPALIDGLENLSSADVQGAVDASIESYHLDHLLLNGGSLADFVNDQSVFAWLMAISGDISDSNDVTDSLEAIRNQVDQIPTKPSAPRIR